MINVLIITQFYPFSAMLIMSLNYIMTLIFKNISKLFQPNYDGIDAKDWVQKLILKKYLKKN